MNIKEQIKILEQQIEEAPHSAQLWEDLADLYMQKEYPEKAIEAYEFALAIEPERSSATCKKNIAYLTTDDAIMRSKGMEFLLEYCKQHPQETELLKILNKIKELDEKEGEPTVITLSNTDNYTDIPCTDEELDWELIENPETPFEEYIEVVDHLYLNQHYTKAIEVTNKLITIHPDDYELYVMLGAIFMKKENLKESKRLFRIALLKTSSQEEKDDCYAEIAIQYFEQEMYHEAFDAYNHIQTIDIMQENIPYIAVCCLELEYRTLYFFYIKQLNIIGNEDVHETCQRAFFDYLPKRINPAELIPFLLKLYDRYNA